MNPRHRRREAPEPPTLPNGPRVVVIGPCASGKSTLVAGLRRLGFAAAACGQEHSEIPTLWRHTDPDIVVALEVDLDTIRERRDASEWPDWLYAAQRRRLRQAEAAATLHVDTTRFDAAAVLELVASYLGEEISTEAEDWTGPADPGLTGRPAGRVIPQKSDVPTVSGGGEGADR